MTVLPAVSMLGTVEGPWLCLAALLLLAVARKQSAPDSEPLWPLWLITLAAGALRLHDGLWGPLHVNGQAPLWVRGAIEPDALSGYGPGYFELLSWITHFGNAPDRAVFTANALLSAASPFLLYLTARSCGVSRSSSLAVTLILAADAVSIRTAATEGYFAPMVALILAVQLSLALGLAAIERRKHAAATFAWIAGGLFAAAAARIHPMSYLPLAASPLVVFGAQPSEDRKRRWRRTILAGATVAAVVLLSSGRTIITALRASQMTGNAISGLAPGDVEVVATLFVGWLVLQRWIKPPWLPLLGIISLLMMLVTHHSFQEHPLQKLSYQRLFWPGILLGAAALPPRRLQTPAGSIFVAGIVACVLWRSSATQLQMPTTEQLEYRFLQTTLPLLPPDCTFTSVTHAGQRLWEMPSYLLPSRRPGSAPRRSLEGEMDLHDAINSTDCVVYVHSSLCTSIEGRPLCQTFEREPGLQTVAGQKFPALPSFAGLPYDRSEVEVVVFQARRSGSPKDASTVAVNDGAAITPTVAQALYDRLVPLRESDGCTVASLDTSRFRVKIALRTATGTEAAFEIATARSSSSGRRAGEWSLAVGEVVERNCSATLAAIERVLQKIGVSTAADAGEPTV